MPKTPTVNRKRFGLTITLDPKVVQRFKDACGFIPISRQIEELMKQWLEKQEKKGESND